MKIRPMKYKRSTPSIFLLIAIVLVWFAANSPLFAQTCTFTIEMLDEAGDGWKDNKLTVISNKDTTTHTLTAGFKGTSTFQVKAATVVKLFFTSGAFATEVAFNLYNPDGLLLYSSGPVGAPAPKAGEHYFRPAYCPNCPAPKASSITFSQITDTTATVQWSAVTGGKRYILRYGPKGFPIDKGLSIDSVSTNAKLTGLNPDVEYDVYLLAKCGVDSSSIFIGPVSFRTTYYPTKAGSSCTYTIELADAGNNGWNGALLRARHKGVNSDFTMAIGSSVTHQFVATGNFPIEFSYLPGAAESENSYKIKDASGKVIFSDGPFPKQGKVFTTIACPTCPGPQKIWMADVNANNAIIAWEPPASLTGNFLVEVGPVGFTLGKGKTTTFAGTVTKGTIPGLKENTWYDVYLKFSCGTEFSKTVGPITFKTIWMNDIGVSGLAAPNFQTGCNFKSDEKLTISITNYGQAPQTLFKFLFAVNGKPANVTIPQDGLYTGVVGNDSTYTIEFETPWDFSVPGLYFIDAWTEMKNDSNIVNDTFRLTILTASPKPLKEDFEDEAVPEIWSHNGLIFKKATHNNVSNVISKNLTAVNNKFTLTTHRVGTMALKDSLIFEYRWVSFPDGKTAFVPGAKDKLEVQVSTDCGVSFTTVLTIDSLNHKPSVDMTRKVIQLGQYAGKALNVRFIGTWGKGDYWLDLDNINIPGCPASLYLFADVEPSYWGLPTGLIAMKPFFGDQPISYKWSNGDTSRVIFNLPPGRYTVSVTDANGCSDSRTFNIGVLVTDEEVALTQPDILVFPNPASNYATLRVQFPKPEDFSFRLLNTQGQILQTTDYRSQSFSELKLDLSPHPPGLYFVQVIQNGFSHQSKLMIIR